MLDLVVDRRELKATIARALRFMRRRVAAPAPAVDALPRSRARSCRLADVSASTASSSSSASNSFGIKFGLDNIATLLRRARPSRARVPLGHVAGTNGKGSVTAMVDAALRAAGHRTRALHLAAPRRLEERFVDRRRARSTTDALDARRADASQAAIDALRRGRRRSTRRRRSSKCTTAIAFELFRDARRRRSPCSRSASAAGSTPPTSSRRSPTAITSIDFDHQAQLGHTLDVDRAREGRHHQAGRAGRRADRCRRGARRDRGDLRRAGAR